MTSKKQPIPHEFSVYLDLLRFAAAFFVVLFHMMKAQLGSVEVLRWIPERGHDAVILFFVLSGYVIAATADRKHAKGWKEYALDRASRVYSTAIPALFFSVLVFVVWGRLLDPVGALSWGGLFGSSLANFFFVAQSWNWQISLYFNSPYWSLCYEVMYYLGFGVFLFTRGWTRWVGISLVALLAGPRVLLLLPCWLLGVVAYNLRDKWKLKPWVAIVVGVLAPLVFLFLLNKMGFGPAVRGFMLGAIGDQKQYLEHSNDFLIDYVTATVVAINLYAMRYFPVPWPSVIAKGIVVGASMSFTLYLMHMPIINLMSALLGEARHTAGAFVGSVVGIVVFCYVTSLFTELKRPVLRAWMARNFLGNSAAGTLRTEKV